jgi:hypothetical protein
MWIQNILYIPLLLKTQGEIGNLESPSWNQIQYPKNLLHPMRRTLPNHPQSLPTSTSRTRLAMEYLPMFVAVWKTRIEICLQVGSANTTPKPTIIFRGHQSRPSSLDLAPPLRRRAIYELYLARRAASY